jgi:hypothetical protein
MLEPAQIDRMSTAERLQVMEQLWTALSRSDEEVPSPLWHGEVLADRKTSAQRGDARFLTLEQLRDRLQQARE